MKALTSKCALMLFLFAVQSVCSFGGSSEHQKKIDYNIHLNTATDSYDSYIESLNPNNLFSIDAAVKKFREAFINSPTNISDDAFVSFWKFYLSAADSAAERLTHTGKYKYLTGIKDYNTNPAEYKNLEYNLTLNKNILNENDFRLLGLLNSYGLMFDVKDGYLIINFGSENFLLNNFGKNLSTAMRDYISETIKEANERLIEKDKIVLPAEKLAERTIWWENFISNNKDFILLSECRLTYNFYLSALLHGIDITHASDFTEHHAEKEFQKVYEIVTKKYSGTKTAAVINQYYSILSKNDPVASEQKNSVPFPFPEEIMGIHHYVER